MTITPHDLRAYDPWDEGWERNSIGRKMMLEAADLIEELDSFATCACGTQHYCEAEVDARLSQYRNRATRAEASRDQEFRRANDNAEKLRHTLLRAERAEAERDALRVERDRYRAAWRSARAGRTRWRVAFGDTENARLRILLEDMTTRAKAWMRLANKAEAEQAELRAHAGIVHDEWVRVELDLTAERDALAAKLARVEATCRDLCLCDYEREDYASVCDACRIRAAIEGDQQ